MKTLTLKPSRRLAIAASCVTLAMLTGAGVANAVLAGGYGSQLGKLYLSAPNGFGESIYTLNTDGPCPSGSAYVAAFISHVDTLPAPQSPANTWEDVLYYSPSPNGWSGTAPMHVPIGDTLYNTAITRAKNMPNGLYTIRVRCQNRLGAPILGFYEGSLTLTNPTAPTANLGATYVSTPAPAASAPTVTTSATPATGALGTPIAISATVQGAGPGGIARTPSGGLSFFDGTTNIGMADLDSTGKASISTTTLTNGSHSITSQYAGDMNFAATTSAAVTVTVGTPVTTTTTPPVTTTTTPPVTTTTTPPVTTTTTPPVTTTTTPPVTTTTTPPVTTTTTSPSTTVTAVGSDGSALPDGSTLSAGDIVAMSGAGFTNGESVRVVLGSSPTTTLGTVTASSAGTMTYSFTVPSTLANGSHTLTLQGQNSSAVYPFVIAAASSTTTPAPTSTTPVGTGVIPVGAPNTGAGGAAGSNDGLSGLGGLALLLAGAAATLVARRRQHI